MRFPRGNQSCPPNNRRSRTSSSSRRNPDWSIHMIRYILAAAVAVLLPAALLAQSPATSTAAANPATQAVKGQFAIIKADVAKTAEKVPEELYSFKPTPDIRSMGQLIGHIADAQFMMCAAAA